eukprot:gene15119-17740_t
MRPSLVARVPVRRCAASSASVPAERLGACRAQWGQRWSIKRYSAARRGDGRGAGDSGGLRVRTTPSQRRSARRGRGAAADESLDFFAVVAEDMSRANNFYIGKLAELRISLEEILSERRNAYRSHHTSADASYLLRLRDIYVDLAALRSFCELNKTGLYKIIKKHDKVMQTATLEGWLKTIERQSFSHAAEPVTLMEQVTSLVSRDKLIEWERFATEQQMRSSDDIFPSVRFPNLAASVLVFVVLASTPAVLPTDPAASRCLALTVF